MQGWRKSLKNEQNKFIKNELTDKNKYHQMIIEKAYEPNEII